MNTMILDTETTSLRPGHICQLSYILNDGDNLTGKNYYFSVPEMGRQAQDIHGLSREMLVSLSGGRMFPDSIDEIEQDYRNAEMVIGHNISFDLQFIRREFERCEKALPRRKLFCTMKHFTGIVKLSKKGGRYKYPSLEELMTYLGIGSRDVMDTCIEVFGEGDLLPHDARYDTAAVHCCLEEAEKRGLISIF